jgi:hypothetical protein
VVEAAAGTRQRIALGLRETWQQFTLLVLINAFVGGMVGLERTLVPLIGSETFQLASTVVITSFIVSFGVVRAITNLISGQLADTWGRKRTLMLGWAVGIPVPFLIMWASGWKWIVAANVLLGINQGLSWSMTVIMKIDLVGPRQRGPRCRPQRIRRLSRRRPDGIPDRLSGDDLRPAADPVLSRDRIRRRGAAALCMGGARYPGACRVGAQSAPARRECDELR